MKKFGFLIAGLALVAFTSQAQAASAKFAATWDNNPIVTTATSTCIDSVCTPRDDNPDYEIEMATIHIATHKSVLIGVSAQIGIHLITKAKGKGGSTGGCNDGCDSTAIAEGSIKATLALVDPNGAVCQTIAPDSEVILKSEARTLKVDATATDGDISVFVGIDTNSVSANSFQFLGVECEQGTYKLTVTFTDNAIAEALGVDSLAMATVTLGKRMITMQEVRAVKGSLVEDSP